MVDSLLDYWDNTIRSGNFKVNSFSNNKPKEDKKPSRPLPEKDPGFVMFAKWFSIPEFFGLYKWQEEHHKFTWDAEYEMTLAPRDHGKSATYNAKYQWAMQYKDFDILLLGWTDRRKQIAVYVYNFFFMHDLIETDRRTTPFHFRIKNGGRFDCYLITSKETLGMHSEGAQDRFVYMSEEDWFEYKSLFNINIDEDYERTFDEEELRAYVESRKGSERKLWISIDDPIDISMMKERHKENSLELHFNSSLYGIHPDKWSFTGTRKFEGDFFDFIDAKFGKELVKYIKGTRNPDGSLLCPERFTHPDLPTYRRDLESEKRDLAKVREHVGEYAWFSEYEQNPHPITGEVWENIGYINLLDTPVNRYYDLCFITIDRATTMKESSDFTGCIIGLRHKKTGERHIIEDLSGNISFDDLLIRLNDYIIDFRKHYKDPTIIVVVEKQGGGDDFITLARKMREFVRSDGTRVDNKIPELVVIEDIHNTGEKLQRIKERLYAPIKNERIKFMRYMEKTEVITELLNFPHSAKFDAIDSLANSEFIILEKYNFTPIDEGTTIHHFTKILQDKNKFRTKEERLEEELRNTIKKNQRRNIFDKF